MVLARGNCVVVGYADVFVPKGNRLPSVQEIHVQHQDSYAKFWLTPVRLARSTGYDAPTLNKLHSLVRANEMLFLEKWNEHFTR